MIKKLTAVILLIGLFICIIPVSAANLFFNDDYSDRIEISSFKFEFKRRTGTLPISEPMAGGGVRALCNVKRTDVGTGEQSCTLVLMVYKNNNLKGIKTATVSAPADKTELPVATEFFTFDLAPDFGNKNDYKIYAYIWNGFDRNSILPGQPNILSRHAEYGSTTNTLYKLNVNNTPIDLFEDFTQDENDENQYNYTHRFSKLPNSIPTIIAKADDLGATIEMTAEDPTDILASRTITVKPNLKNAQERIYNISYEVEAKEKIVENAISADTCSRTNYSGDTTPTGKYMYTNLYNGSPMNNGRNGTLKRGLIQVDVTKFPDDISLIKDVRLVVVGQCFYNANHITEYCPSSFTVNAYAFSETDFSWAETGINAVEASANTVGPGLEDIIATTPFDSFTVDKSANTTGEWVEKEVNITDLIKTAKQNNEEKVTVILLADNTDRATQFFVDLYTQSTNNRDELMFKMGTKENTSDTYTKGDEMISVQPQVIMEYYEREE